jgi:hypothetical protein
MTERDLHALLHAANPEHFPKFDHDRHMPFPLLEYAIRDAITARGWAWLVCNDEADVTSAPNCMTYQHVNENQPPGVALGLAFIEMLEVTK